jgi:hypothetical protein
MSVADAILAKARRTYAAAMRSNQADIDRVWRLNSES